jgi:(R)-2-hydroxyglutarate---pyruvate transhydrogenase
MLRVRTTTIVSCLHRPATRLLSTTNVLASQYKSLHNAVTSDDIAHFSSILPKSSILSTLAPINTPPEDLDSYNNDWMTRYKGHSQCVLKPRSTKEVSDILKWCYQRKIAVVPQGGNTGLVGPCALFPSFLCLFI